MMTTNWPRAKGTWDMLDQKVTILVPTSSTLVVKGTRKSPVCPDHGDKNSFMSFRASHFYQKESLFVVEIEDSYYVWF